MSTYTLRPPPRLGMPSILAVVIALASYPLSFTGHWIWGIVAAVIGIVCGLLGMIWAALPGIRGAYLSLIAILLSVIAIIPAILSAMGKFAIHS